MRFSVNVVFEGENPDNRHEPLVYYHRTPKAAARRLAAIINGKAHWVPSYARVGSRFFIVAEHFAPGTELSLKVFKDIYALS